jgi:hypothetical protein
MRSLRSLALVLLLALAGCGRTPDALVSRQISVLDEAAETLATITDESSADAAAPKLGKLQRELNDLVPRVKALDLKHDEREAVENKHREQMESARKRFEAEVERVGNLKLKAGGLSHLEKAIEQE